MFIRRSVAEVFTVLCHCRMLLIVVVLAGFFVTAMGAEPSAKAAPPSGAVPRRVPWTSSRIAGTPEPPSPYTVELAFPHLKFENPVTLVPGAGERLFLGDLKGRIWSFPDDPDCRQADLAFDLRKPHPDVTALYGLICDPRFDENPYVYVCYTLQLNQPEGTVVSRFKAIGSNPPTIDPQSEEVLLRFWSGGHNGGCLAFGRDGCLYISTGDGTDPSPPDGKQTGQDCTDFLSSILRIDVNHPEPGKPYRVPADNPYVNTPGVRPEIWAYGFRNPWKMSVDSVSGDLWVGDVGWELWEMIDRVERGGNYGWSIMEGPQAVQPDARRGPSPVLPPTVAHPHSEAASITGGYVYHGRRLPDLKGAYLYGDYQTGTIWGVRHDGKNVTWRGELARTPLHLAAFGETRQGELYLLDHDRTHQIYRLVPNPESKATSSFPRKLSETGLFASTPEHRPAPGVVPYEVTVELWSDGARAERLLAVPGDGKITRDDSGQWRVPDGTVLARTVSIELEAGKKGTRRRIETQILHLEAGAWRPYTYVWSDDQSDAVLAEAGGASKALVIKDTSAPGGTRTRDHRIHARAECVLCHNPWVEKKTTIFGAQSASPLGLNAPQMDREVELDGAKVNQLAALELAGLIDASARTNKLPRLAALDDDSVDLERRARSYLQVHCSHCHQFNAGGTATIALAFELPLDQTRTVDARPVQGTFNLPDARIIAPGDPSRSVLYYRIAKLGGGRMPRIGSGQVDERATRLIHDWIASMKPSGGNQRVAVDGIAPEDRAALKELSAAKATSTNAHNEALHRLMSSTRGGLLLLDILDRGPVAVELRREILPALRDNIRVEVRDLFERFIPDAERLKRLGDVVDRRALLALSGDIERGRAVFVNNPAAQCKTCHKVGDAGEQSGLDLAKIGSKYDRATILDHILEPSKTIDPQHTTYLVALKDGQVLTGLIVERGDDFIAVRDAQAKVHQLPRSEVEQLAPQAKSLMPELLLRDLTPQQAADLIAFLAAQK